MRSDRCRVSVLDLYSKAIRKHHFLLIRTHDFNVLMIWQKFNREIHEGRGFFVDRRETSSEHISPKIVLHVTPGFVIADTLQSGISEPCAAPLWRTLPSLVWGATISFSEFRNGITNFRDHCGSDSAARIER